MPITFDADRFRTVAEEHGDRTVEQIAQRTGLNVGLISRLLTGKRQPTFSTAIQAADAYCRSASEFANRGEAA